METLLTDEQKRQGEAVASTPYSAAIQEIRAAVDVILDAVSSKTGSLTTDTQLLVSAIQTANNVWVTQKQHAFREAERRHELEMAKLRGQEGFAGSLGIPGLPRGFGG